MVTPKPKGLGRGLDALLGGSLAVSTSEAAADRLTEAPCAALRPGRYQPRTRMDDASLAELAQSIKARGIIQPIVVRPLKEAGAATYEILAGERRWRAAQLARLETVPVVVRDVPDEAALAFGLIENIQREDLNAIEEATGIKRLIEEFKLTHDEIANAVGRSRAAVTNLLRLLELTPPVRQQLEEGKLEMGHARALLGLVEAWQVAAANEVVAKGLSVRETERLVRARQLAKTAPPSRAVGPDADTRRLQVELADAIGASVEIRHRRGGKGELLIRYASLEQLDGVIARLKREQ